MNEEAMDADMSMYDRVYDYTQYSHDNHVNVIPEQAFKRLVRDTFKTITDTLRSTYGPYGSSIIISDQNETITTKDGYNVFESMGFNHHYKKMVYLAINKICERVNRTVGDGTTSCILLAESMFNALNAIIQTPDDKRTILSVLTDIEKSLQQTEELDKDMADGVINKLTSASIQNVISLASNYDDELTDTLVKAMLPDWNPDTKDDTPIESVRNVIVETEVTYDSESNVTYEIDYFPGDYRVRVNMDTEFGLSFRDPQEIKICIFDHAFGPTDWNNFMVKYNEERVLIISRAYTRTFMDNEYVRYLKERAFTKTPVNIILCEIKGDFVQNEISDLCSILKTKPYGLHSDVVDHDELPVAKVQVYKGNALCFYDIESPTEYIETLKLDMKKDLSKSYIKKKDYLDRIKALSLSAKDTLVTVKGGTSLEVKLIGDKIDDCTSIVHSALHYGIVPNMLHYAAKRIKRMMDDTNTMKNRVCTEIYSSILTLFNMIWESKYGDANSDEMSDKCVSFYESQNVSYDIVRNTMIEVEALPTSAQYDIEVVVAAISIVKYLLTSRALVFDAFLLKPQGDEGKYQHL